MAQMQLVKHGSNAGYRRELETDNVCDRCRNAHRQYAKQFTKAGKAKGLKYSHYDVIDHLYQAGTGTARQRPGTAPSYSPPTRDSAAREDTVPPGPAPADPDPAQTRSDPSIGNRIGDALRGFVGQRSTNEYVETDEPPDYITAGIPDPEPEGDWSQPKDEADYVITKEGLALIEDNLGTYLSVIGITLEMIDPYCGPILAENFGNIIGRWTKVIARYPKAAKLFMSKDGGTLFLWIGALQATWPVLLAVYEHHLARTVKVNNLGQPYRVTKPSANGHAPDVDATMPGQSFNYTVD